MATMKIVSERTTTPENLHTPPTREAFCESLGKRSGHVKVDRIFARSPDLPHKKVLAIGDATHGSEELFKLQADIAKHLVTKHSARLILLEIPLAYAEQAETIMRREGDCRDNLRAFIDKHPAPAWSNRPIIELLTGIAEWNHRYPSSQVRVIGIDPQPGVPLSSQAPQGVRSDLESWHQRASRVVSRQQATEGQHGGEGKVVKQLLREAHKLLHDSDKPLSQSARRSLNRWCQWLQINNSDSPLVPLLRRELTMAKNVVESIATLQPGETAVLCGHNSHVKNGDGRMGYLLKEACGEDYAVLLTAVGAGGVRSYDHSRECFTGEVHELNATPPGSYEEQLSQLKEGHTIYCDLSDQTLRDVLSHAVQSKGGTTTLREAGSPYPRGQIARDVPLEHSCDGLIFFPQVQAVRGTEFTTSQT